MVKNYRIIINSKIWLNSVHIHLDLLSSQPRQSTTALNNNSVGSKLEDLFFLFRFVRFAERRRSDLGPITPAIRTTPPARSAKLNGLR